MYGATQAGRFRCGLGRGSIWKKTPSEVSEEEYTEFYKHVGHDYTDPLKVIHYRAEGTAEFQALLYIPSQAPTDLFWPDAKRGLHLYVKNVFINDDCEALLPSYLRFLKGVVDSSDLPLNVSREVLQDDVVIRRIRKSLVTRVLKELAELKERTPENFLTFYEQFGTVIDPSLREVLKNSGCLTRDARMKERKKAGQPGARKRFQFSKR